MDGRKTTEGKDRAEDSYIIFKPTMVTGGRWISIYDSTFVILEVHKSLTEHCTRLGESTAHHPTQSVVTVSTASLQGPSVAA